MAELNLTNGLEKECKNYKLNSQKKDQFMIINLTLKQKNGNIGEIQFQNTLLI